MKAAWRQRTQRRDGAMTSCIAEVLKADKRLGPIWRRLIAWGVISEEEARLLAASATRRGTTFYDDRGARFVLGLALGQLIEATARGRQKEPGPVAHFLGEFARTGDPRTLDSRLIAFLEAEAHMDPATVRRDLDALRKSGDYERIVKDARAETP
jgi:hypothetical protein